VIDAKGDFDFLAIPGRGNCGPDHWMSHWCQVFPNSSRVLQAEWEKPDPKDWIAKVDAAVAQAPRKVVLLAHSLAVATTVKWAAQAGQDRIDKVAAVLLVAPTNVADPDPSFDTVRAFAPMPLKPLPFPALVVASRSDPRVTFDKATEFAAAWGADLADAGDLGHMGNEARLGIWPNGLLLLGRLLQQARL
jgi:predicted alpha/beta hydrolase family esterase